MYIWNKTGTKLVKTEDIMEIVLADETEMLREKHPATNGELYVLRAYYKAGDRSKSTVLASYDSYENAQAMFIQFVEALGKGATVFSFLEYRLEDDINPPEEQLEQDL